MNNKGKDIPETIDADVLQSYLGDHLTGAEAGRARALDMAERFADTEIGPDLARIADEIDQEYAYLQGLIEALGLSKREPLRVVARLGEAFGRLKPNGRGPAVSPVTPHLELELLRGAVSAKEGLWETMAHYATELSLDPAEFGAKAQAAADQRETLTALHDRIVDTALRPGAGIAG